MEIRPIDANALREEIKRGVNVVKGTCNISQILHNIDAAPTLDYEPVVHCKDCMFNSNNGYGGKCDRMLIQRKTKGNYEYFKLNYCEHGAKMDEEVNNVTKL